jgi:hypothetical protein
LATAPRPAWGDDDRRWEETGEAALAAHRAARDGDAHALWRRASDLAVGFAAGDPRRAASLGNLALAARTADADLDSLRAAWRASHDWVAQMAPDAKGGSSSFHLRLERRHAEAYAVRARATAARELDAGLAVAVANAGLAALATGRRADTLALLVEARGLRVRALGAGEAGAAWLAAVEAAIALGSSPPSPPELPWPRRRPPPGDRRRLLAAIYLSAFAR